MGGYLNSRKAGAVYEKIQKSTYFVDKTKMLEELILIVNADPDDAGMFPARGKELRYICITRPRRFGKTVAASMIALFFGKGADSSSVFQNLAISQYQGANRHLNQHNVIYIMFNEIPKNCTAYEQYIERIERRLMNDLMKAYPKAGIDPDGAVWDALNDIYESEVSGEFIFVLDEWDFIYHQNFAAEVDKAAFTRFLSVLLKDQPYVEMAYMTGILPIAKYSSGSELNMFCEYTMVTEEKYSGFFGFTESEVDGLYAVYQKQDIAKRNVTREGLLYCIRANVDDVKEDIGLLVSEIPLPANVQEYAAASMELGTRDEIFSAMVVYGFLNYENGQVSIPNKELMDKFADLVQKESSLGVEVLRERR